MATIKVEGLRQLGQAMRTLSADVNKKIARAATGAGAQVVKKAVKAAVRDPRADEAYKVEGTTVQPGNISRNVVAKALKPHEAGMTSMHIVTVRGKKKHGYASRIGALQEFGTVNMPANPFMRPGFEGSKTQAVEAIKNRLKQRIDKASKK